MTRHLSETKDPAVGRPPATAKPQPAPQPGKTAKPSDDKLRVAVVDPDPQVAAALQSAATEMRLPWTITAHRGPAQGLPALAALLPHAVVLEAEFPKHCGIVCARRLRALLPGTRVLMLTTRADNVGVIAALMAGVRGYLFKPLPGPELARSLARVLNGERVLLHGLDPLLDGLDALGSRIDWSPLSRRQQEVIACYLRSMYDKESSTELGISERTVNRHWQDIYELLNVRDRHSAVLRLFSLPIPPLGPRYAQRGCLACGH
jgi:two-component system, NarL family, nitrate/nitrite response regulator NarL